MADITVAIPVYNGEAYLERCLRSLERQSATNFKALIYDNASTDGTRSIAEAFCSSDARFSYVRQPTNKGAAANFFDSLNTADTELFFWLAHDDEIGPNYIEELSGLFRKFPHINLAVPAVHAVREDGSLYGDYPIPNMETGDRVMRIGRLLREAHPSWFYAIWRTEILRDSFSRVWDHYPYDWASDHLTIFTQIIRGKIVGSAKATFQQTIQHRPTRRRPEVTSMRGMRAQFKSFCIREIEELDFSTQERARLHYLIDRYTSHRCFGYRKIFRRYLREVFIQKAH